VEVRRNLPADSDELGILSAALRVVCDDLEVVRLEGTSSLAACAIEITARVRQLERNALHAEVNQCFAIACSHYGDSIDLEVMCHGYAPDYEVHKLEEMETAVAPFSQDLADRIEDIVLPRGASKLDRSGGRSCNKRTSSDPSILFKQACYFVLFE